MALSYNLGYHEIISVHPTRRQIFAGKTDSTFWNIWQWVVPSYTDPVLPSYTQYCPILTQYHQLQTVLPCKNPVSSYIMMSIARMSIATISIATMSIVITIISLTTMSLTTMSLIFLLFLINFSSPPEKKLVFYKYCLRKIASIRDLHCLLGLVSNHFNVWVEKFVNQKIFLSILNLLSTWIVGQRSRRVQAGTFWCVLNVSLRVYGAQLILDWTEL